MVSYKDYCWKCNERLEKLDESTISMKVTTFKCHTCKRVYVLVEEFENGSLISTNFVLDKSSVKNNKKKTMHLNGVRE